MTSSKKSPFVRDLIQVFLIPTLINKPFMLYFGIHYAAHPGEGYGYGLVITIFILLFTAGRFLWKYRHESDPS